jgi:hypothetical protein
MESYPVVIPSITWAEFSVNPANINTKTKLSASVSEVTIYLEPYYYYAGELYSGEV